MILPVPSSFFLPQFYVLSMTLYSLEYPLGQVGSAVPGVSSPSFFPASLLVGWAVRQKRP